MNTLPYTLPLAQAPAWNAPAAPAPAPTQRTLTFSDLKSGLRAYQTGDSRDHARTTTLVVIVAVVLLAGILLHLRQRRKTAGPPDSAAKLSRELCRVARLPLTVRLLLWRVSRAANLPLAALLLSSTAYDHALATWSARPTFGPARRWAHTKLTHTKPHLFPNT